MSNGDKKKTIGDDKTLPPGDDGRILNGRYRIIRKLGEGGMGEVHLAEDMELNNRKVAIKTLPLMIAANERALKQLKSEAELSMKLSHPHIATLRSFETSPEGPFLVMDYIEGWTLEDRLAGDETLTEDETLRIFKPLAEAVDYAHSQGVIHRDIKPSNIIIRKDGTPFITDFGIARELKETMTRMSRGSTSGTVPYMSPEQLEGAAPAPAQDIYSLATAMYECLTGRTPFFRGNIEYQIVNKEPDLSVLPPGMQFRIGAGLSKDPDRRPASGTDLVTGKMKVTKKGKTGHSFQLNRIHLMVGVLLVMVILGIGMVTGKIPTAFFGFNGSDTGVSSDDVPSDPRDTDARFIPVEDEPVDDSAQVVSQPPEVSDTSQPVMTSTPIPTATPYPTYTPVPTYTKPPTWTPSPRPSHTPRPTRKPTPGVKTIHLGNGVSQDMVYIKGGSFQMGSPESETGRDNDEGPVHRVELDGFWMGKYEVTQAQYQSVMGENPSHFKDSDRPVERVSWNDAMTFCRKLSSRTGQTFNLPTEAQWEFACRAGSQTRFCFGDSDDDLGDYAWYRGNSGGKTHEVGKKQPNSWGLYDMHGNVWEWCLDDYHGSYNGAPSDGSRWGDGSGSYRVFRGGCWRYFAGLCRSANRLRHTPSYSSIRLGFRVVITDHP